MAPLVHMLKLSVYDLYLCVLRLEHKLTYECIRLGHPRDEVGTALNRARVWLADAIENRLELTNEGVVEHE